MLEFSFSGPVMALSLCLVGFGAIVMLAQMAHNSPRALPYIFGMVVVSCLSLLGATYCLSGGEEEAWSNLLALAGQLMGTGLILIPIVGLLVVGLAVFIRMIFCTPKKSHESEISQITEEGKND